MPELPEVETVRRSLSATILGKRIAAVTPHHPKVLRPSVRDAETALRGATFTEIDRVGKLLIIATDKPDLSILIHLKMTGQLIYSHDREIIAGGHSLTHDVVHDHPSKHTRLTIEFEDGGRLFFNDMRLFGYVEAATERRVDAARKKFGPELIDSRLTKDAWYQLLHRRKTSIKAVLLNQTIVAGIGNIYADEMCFAAGVLPHRPAHALSRAECDRLFTHGKRILALAIEERGTTFNHYVDGQGNKGNFLRFLRVYGRGGKPCITCSSILAKKKVAGRGTVYCATCQK